MSLEVNIGDFLLDNFLGPFLQDITTSALGLLSTSLGGLLGSLLGKRQIDFNDFIQNNLIDPFLTDVTSGLNTMLNNLLQNLTTSLVSSLFGK